MAGKDLKDLISAYGRRDDLQFRRAAQALISEVEAKRHNVLARDLRLLLANSSTLTVAEGPALSEPPVDRDSSTPLATIKLPDRRFDSLVLNSSAREVFESYASEVRRWPELDSAGLPRRNRILLYGPPGCGKTSAVEALATQLGRPLVTAKIDALVSSYLGETASNLRKLFEYADSGAFVLFLDEFDSLGKLRDDVSDHGELRRVVNAVLQLIDNYSGPSIIVAATNHPQILDSALWRRFDLVEEMPLPTKVETHQVLSNLLRGRVGLDDLHEMTESLHGLPHAAAEFAAHSALRRAVLAGERAVPYALLRAAIDETAARRWV